MPGDAYQYLIKEFADAGGSKGGEFYTPINPDSFKSIAIALAPLPEQQKISSILSSIDDQIDAHQTKLTALTKLKFALMQQLLTGKTRVCVYNQ